MARRRYLIAYDIREPTRLRRICKIMEEYGERLQYSVFICDLTKAELVHARAAIERVMAMDADSLVIVDLGETHEARFTFVGARRPLPTVEPRIL